MWRIVKMCEEVEERGETKKAKYYDYFDYLLSLLYFIYAARFDWCTDLVESITRLVLRCRYAIVIQFQI